MTGQGREKAIEIAGPYTTDGVREFQGDGVSFPRAESEYGATVYLVGIRYLDDGTMAGSECAMPTLGAARAFAFRNAERLGLSVRENI